MIASQPSDGHVLLVLVGILSAVLFARWMWFVLLPAAGLALLRLWFGAQGRTRAGIVLSAVLTSAALLYARWTLYFLVPAVLWFAGRMIWRWYWWRPHYKVNVVELHKVLAPYLGYPLELDPLAYLDIPVGLLDGEGAITITLPNGYWPSEKDKAEIINRTVVTLNLPAVRADWRLNGQNRHLHLSNVDKTIPELVPFDDHFQALLEDSPAHRKLVGKTKGDKPFYLDFLEENPHVLLSCLTGWGKTTALGVMLADELHKGGEVALLDIKFGSMRWAYGLPGVTYSRTVETIHEDLLAIGRELHRRKEKLGNTVYTEDPSYTRLFIVIEEINALVEELRDYWTEKKAELKQEAKEAGITYNPPMKSPAIKAYRQVLLMGRQLGINLVAVAQRAEANEVGGGVARSQMGTKILGWADVDTWRMLAKQHPYQPSSGRPGHAYVSRGKYLSEVQFVRTKPDELRAWATSGKTPASTLSQPSQAKSEPRHQGVGQPGVLGQPALTLVHDTEPEPRLVTLRQASSDYGEDGGLVPEKLVSLNKESRRDALFPKPVGDPGPNGAYYYDPEQVVAWSSNRPANARRRRTG